MRLLLFDIDGTLIDSGGAGTRSLNLAFKKVFSIKNALYGVSMAGKTDTQIIKEGLIKHGVLADGKLDDIINTYLEHLQEEINNDRKHTKPGVREILGKLSLMEDTGLGLLTGNLEQGARIKLGAFDLNRYFRTGAFGSDDEERNNLLPIAIKRYEEIIQEKINTGECIIIGDTPRDVECTHIYRAMCIGVATGPYSFESLVEAGADYVVEDLSDHHTL